LKGLGYTHQSLEYRPVTHWTTFGQKTDYIYQLPFI